MVNYSIALWKSLSQAFLARLIRANTAVAETKVAGHEPFTEISCQIWRPKGKEETDYTWPINKCSMQIPHSTLVQHCVFSSNQVKISGCFFGNLLTNVNYGTVGIQEKWTVGAYMVWLVSPTLRARVTESREEHSSCWTSVHPLYYMSWVTSLGLFQALCALSSPVPFSCYILPILHTFGRFGGEELWCPVTAHLPSCRAFSFSDNCFFSPRTGSVSPLVIFYGTQQMTKQSHYSSYHSTESKPSQLTSLLKALSSLVTILSSNVVLLHYYTKENEYKLV